MITVGGDEAIITSHTSLAAGSNSLLTVIQVAETTDFALLVQRIGEDLHSAHESHLVEQKSEFFLGGCGLGWQLVGVQMVSADDSWL